MPRKKAKEPLDYLEPTECAQVLHELLERHKELRGEANEIAVSLFDDVSVEEVAENVAALVGSFDMDDLSNRAGPHSWGYVEPNEAAWELLEESLDDIRTDMIRRAKADMKPAAEKVYQGIVIGLYNANKEANEEGNESDGILAYAEEFPEETACSSLSLLLELYPPRQRQAAGNRIIRGVEEKADGWVKMLGQVVTELANEKQRKRK